MSPAESDTRIVVTGLGVLASIGSDVNSFWDSLVAGRSGIGPVTRFDSTDIASKVASEVKDFDPATEMDPKEVRRARQEEMKFVQDRRIYEYFDMKKALGDQPPPCWRQMD